MNTGVTGNHKHTWNPGDKRTSVDDDHDHAVTNPSSGWTNEGGMDKHKHTIRPKVVVKKK